MDYWLKSIYKYSNKIIKLTWLFFFGKFNIRFLAFEQGIPTKFIEVIVNSMKYFIYNIAI